MTVINPHCHFCIWSVFGCAKCSFYTWKLCHFQSEIWCSPRWGVQEWHSWSTVGKFLALMCCINKFFVTCVRMHNLTHTAYATCPDSLFRILWDSISSAIIIMKNKTDMKVYCREFDTGCHFIKKNSIWHFRWHWFWSEIWHVLRNLHCSFPEMMCLVFRKTEELAEHWVFNLFALAFKWLQSTFAYDILFARHLNFSTWFTKQL